mmetsp:Transcript_14186/g.17921  ORF Transcript_14186/g.17921 Transcript_14186/m.17921 type:complete len:85 (+) Transcript_14186:420-674(+)
MNKSFSLSSSWVQRGWTPPSGRTTQSMGDSEGDDDSSPSTSPSAPLSTTSCDGGGRIETRSFSKYLSESKDNDTSGLLILTVLM